MKEQMSSMSYGVASNQIQAELSAKSSSSLLHRLHIKKRLRMGKWAQQLIHFNRFTSVDYKNAGHGEQVVFYKCCKQE